MFDPKTTINSQSITEGAPPPNRGWNYLNHQMNLTYVGLESYINLEEDNTTDDLPQDSPVLKRENARIWD